MWFASTAVTHAAAPATAKRSWSFGISRVASRNAFATAHVARFPIVHDDAEQRHLPGRQEHRRRDQEHPGGVERGVAGGADRERVGRRRADREQEERRPRRSLVAEPREAGRGEAQREDPDREAVRRGGRGHAGSTPRLVQRVDTNVGWDRAHSVSFRARARAAVRH
jgi:hypothetical protein